MSSGGNGPGWPAQEPAERWAASPVEAILAAELDQPVMPEARAMAAAILAQHGAAVAAILFYGSCLRTGDPSGLLDFYVLVDRPRDWHGGPGLRAALTALLPPDVEHWTVAQGDRTLRAKVAIIPRARFRRALRPASLDTTIWARFCQPVALLHARDDAARAEARAGVAAAVRTAVNWAVRLGPEEGTPADYWRALFRATYGAELRAERGDRAALVHAAAADRYDALLRAALPDAAPAPDGRLRPRLGPAQRAAARRGWALRRALGKPLNVARLVKAAFTFAGGADYLAWKVERHSGVALHLTPWQRRHPILAAPALLWRLRRAGAVR
ncbi:hypothetical protein [Roseomonas sp. BN140053]|uniref:hypothetical protein n=1 Tax=Roseomonas sp. BN140053 TaxID=3391898 RepID=UPI0039E87E03